MSKTPFLLAASAAPAVAAATPALADDGRSPFDGMTEQAISQIITYAGYDAVDIDLKGRMLQHLGGRHHPPLVVQEVGDEPVSERRQGDGHALERHAHLARVETERPGLEERATMAGDRKSTRLNSSH